jgi:hypothetical protein
MKNEKIANIEFPNSLVSELLHTIIFYYKCSEDLVTSRFLQMFLQRDSRGAVPESTNINNAIGYRRKRNLASKYIDRREDKWIMKLLTFVPVPLETCR